MKKIFIILCIFFVSYLSFAQKATIYFCLEEVTKPLIIEYSKFEGRSGEVFFTDTLTNGNTKVTINLPVSEVFSGSIMFTTENDIISKEIYLKSGGEYTIKGKITDHSSIKITSSNVIEQSYYNEMDETASKYKSQETWMGRFNALKQQPYSAVKKQYLLITTSLLSYFPEMLHDGALEVYNSLPDSLKNEIWVKELELALNPDKTLKIGDIVKASFHDMEGNKISINSFRGKYLLIDFWGKSCAPCIAAIPELETICKTYAESLNIISITTDTHDVWLSTAEEHKFAWSNLADDKGAGGLVSQLKAQMLPTYVMISAEGRILDITSGYKQGKIIQWVEKLIK